MIAKSTKGTAAVNFATPIRLDPRSADTYYHLRKLIAPIIVLSYGDLQKAIET